MKIKEDMTNKVFGRLTVISRDLNIKKKDSTSYWICSCSCGITLSVCRASLIKGNTKSCGCLRAEKSTLNAKRQVGKIKPVKEDLTYRIFGQLVVLKRDISKIGLERGSFWICQCKCGTIKSIARHSLVNHGTVSCGCWIKEKAALRAKPHGYADRNHWLAKYKRRAEKLNIIFTLTNEEFYDICSMNCFYCNAVPTKKSSGHINKIDKGSYFANGIDKVNPSLGYTKENSVPCCKICNFMKTDKNQSEFISKIFEIADNLRRKNVPS